MLCHLACSKGTRSSTSTAPERRGSCLELIAMSHMICPERWRSYVQEIELGTRAHSVHSLISSLYA